MGLGDRIVVMNAGRIRQIGTPDEIYRHPADTFVATFIGTPPMNLVELSGRLVGFRPESIVSGAGETEGMAAIPVRIQRIEYLGNVRLAYAEVLAPFLPTRVIASLPFQIEPTFAGGAVTAFRVPLAELRYFDKESGLALPGAEAPADLPMSQPGPEARQTWTHHG